MFWFIKLSAYAHSIHKNFCLYSSTLRPRLNQNLGWNFIFRIVGLSTRPLNSKKFSSLTILPRFVKLWGEITFFENYGITHFRPSCSQKFTSNVVNYFLRLSKKSGQTSFFKLWTQFFSIFLDN